MSEAIPVIPDRPTRRKTEGEIKSETPKIPGNRPVMRAKTSNNILNKDQIPGGASDKHEVSANSKPEIPLSRPVRHKTTEDLNSLIESTAEELNEIKQLVNKNVKQGDVPAIPSRPSRPAHKAQRGQQVETLPSDSDQVQQSENVTEHLEEISNILSKEESEVIAQENAEENEEEQRIAETVQAAINDMTTPEELPDEKLNSCEPSLENIQPIESKTEVESTTSYEGSKSSNTIPSVTAALEKDDVEAKPISTFKESCHDSVKRNEGLSENSEVEDASKLGSDAIKKSCSSNLGGNATAHQDNALKKATFNEQETAENVEEEQNTQENLVAESASNEDLNKQETELFLPETAQEVVSDKSLAALNLGNASEIQSKSATANGTTVADVSHEEKGINDDEIEPTKTESDTVEKNDFDDYNESPAETVKPEVKPVVPNRRPARKLSQETKNAEIPEDVKTTVEPEKPEGVEKLTEVDSLKEVSKSKGKTGRPPPIPSKPSSKIALFQKMIQQQQQKDMQTIKKSYNAVEEERSISEHPTKAETGTDTGIEAESKPETESKTGTTSFQTSSVTNDSVKTDRTNFKNNLNGLFALPGMVMPGMAPPAALNRVLQPTSAQTSGNSASGGSSPASPANTARSRRGKGPRGRKLPTEVAKAEKITATNTNTIEIFDTWEINFNFVTTNTVIDETDMTSIDERNQLQLAESLEQNYEQQRELEMLEELQSSSKQPDELLMKTTLGNENSRNPENLENLENPSENGTENVPVPTTTTLTEVPVTTFQIEDTSNTAAKAEVADEGIAGMTSIATEVKNTNNTDNLDGNSNAGTAASPISIPEPQTNQQFDTIDASRAEDSTEQNNTTASKEEAIPTKEPTRLPANSNESHPSEPRENE